MAHSGVDVLTLILAMLAVYRVSHMIALEEGPFSVFSWVHGKMNQSTWIGRGLRCTLCISFWLAGLATWIIGGTVLEWLGIAGGVLTLHQVGK